METGVADHGPGTGDGLDDLGSEVGQDRGRGATRLPRAMRPFAGVKIEVDSAVN
jgi:hypothetical protein